MGRLGASIRRGAVSNEQAHGSVDKVRWHIDQEMQCSDVLASTERGVHTIAEKKF